MTRSARLEDVLMTRHKFGQSAGMGIQYGCQRHPILRHSQFVYLQLGDRVHRHHRKSSIAYSYLTYLVLTYQLYGQHRLRVVDITTKKDDAGSVLVR